MDPFVIVSFGKKIFRTKVVRHSLNPVFNERLIFRVMTTEKGYTISFYIYDRDKLSSNDFVASGNMPLSELMENAPSPDPETGLYTLPEPWRESDPVPAKRQDSLLSRIGQGILSRSSSSTNLNQKGNGKDGNSSSAGATMPAASTLELAKTSSTTASQHSGTTFAMQFLTL